ncbi:MAG TPA: ankyrin repeat domain-containing protein [Kofleriaceae bacterium]|nr:ankyrin repeat domain-containing protein [Kofleriaceae bacterium]
MANIFELIDKKDVEGLRTYLSIEPSASGQRDPQGLSVLMRAFYRSPELVEVVRKSDPPLDEWDRLLIGESKGIPPHDAWSPDGFTPLHIAAFAKNMAACKALIADGADPNVIAKAHFAKVTPLGTCAFVNAIEIARLLLDAGANPKIPEGASPIDSARHNKHSELLALLESRA